jgi:hypothetical protein
MTVGDAVSTYEIYKQQRKVHTWIHTWMYRRETLKIRLCEKVTDNENSTFDILDKYLNKGNRNNCKSQRYTSKHTWRNTGTHHKQTYILTYATKR